VRGTARYGDVIPPEELEQLPSVTGSLLDIDVPVDCRDGFDLYLGAREGEEECEGVVDARVGVKEYALQAKSPVDRPMSR
jgi:hypothetical protein